MNITFLGHYSNAVNFGLLRKDNDPYTKNKYGLINNHSNREIGILGAIGASTGLTGGAIYNDIKSSRSKDNTLKALNSRIKGQWKAKAIGAGLGAGLVTGTTLLLRKTRKDKGKKRR